MLEKDKRMDRTWTLDGVYANWKLTIVIEPGEYAYDVPEWPGEKLAPVVEHFFESVNLYELGRDAEQLHRLS
ncbi:hypothetical protein DMA12_28670 [Amycolatopsis balhimycina DSM 5908]|uniref:Uncharacterized protein n=1 Tax=Amycolatopsis balhimycina DSM 5908 TaxID=1081091 RepID=A0A428W9U4_AMYBA|nr:hypothetical protein [Amycolatopsis balhimycina]RSM39876.1 hypothetical protein DMA12_28670 [Amycolatopsis balhimycina DSM 5908]